MGHNNRYAVKYRRRREGKTNYRKRLALLKSRQSRLVVRKTNNNITVQVIDYDKDGDLIKSEANSQQLAKLGWSNKTKNIPAAYLVGYLAGTKAKQAKVSGAVVDIGMQTNFHGGRLFAAVKGAKDAGLDIPVSEDAFPSDERLNGSHISDKVASNVDAVKKKIGGQK